MRRACTKFQSPSGDSLFSDLIRLEEKAQQQRFNPLAGIRCFLTQLYRVLGEDEDGEFQSPSGDSLFSDRAERHAASQAGQSISIVSIP